jgi:THO complex subunit 5
MQSEMAIDTVATAEKSPLELLQQTKASVEAIIAKMLSIKQQGTPKSENRELLTQMFLNFINLRQANRSILIEEEKVRTETEIAKSPVDFTTLELHNLMYEKSHYLKANKASRDFKSRYPNIDLISEQDFFSDAPEAIKSQTLSNDSSHDLMLKRLNFELHQVNFISKFMSLRSCSSLIQCDSMLSFIHLCLESLDQVHVLDIVGVFIQK